MKIRKCEICQQTFVEQYGYALGISWHVTGSAHVAAFNCTVEPSAQHWGCSPEHALEALRNCLENHMNAEVIKNKHIASGKPRYAQEHEHWAKQKGENFHFVELPEHLKEIME